MYIQICKKNETSIRTVIDTRRKMLSGLFTIKMQIIYHRIQKYYTTGKELMPDDWKRLPESKIRKLREIHEKMENSFTIIKQNAGLITNKDDLSFDVLNSEKILQ